MGMFPEKRLRARFVPITNRLHDRVVASVCAKQHIERMSQSYLVEYDDRRGDKWNHVQLSDEALEYR